MASNRRLLALGFGMALAVGCSNGSGSPNASPSPTGSPTPVAQTYTVNVDAGKTDPQVAAFAYFPKAVSVHAGDSISFALQDTGEPHTVAFGSFVEAAFATASKLDPNKEPPPAAQAVLKKVPDLLPQGPGDAFQAAAQPCVLKAGAAAVKDIKKPCADTKPGEFDGTEELYTSGWLAPDVPFTMKVADSAKPGTYHFYCQLHGPQTMSGTVTVVAAGSAVASPAEVATTASTDLTAFVDSLKPAAAPLAKATAAHAFAGALSQKVQNGLVSAFGPASLSIPVGGTVAWQILGPHSISFNPTADAQTLRSVAPDGSVHLNVKAASPAGGPGQGPGTMINGGGWNGSGFHSSGLVVSFPPDLVTYKLTFTKAGTYPYRCLVHLNMEGTVKVG